ncbi:hypothetical protein [Bacteriovorax sp. Seq25_V]|uniref:hypothetical protein n=1 Tax=Bacteriovorax sp. Seq25_V TaxID=1201288 RepID=UPI0012FA6A38|nr:hypothetical protein [Bacteriovorax sp. Seq25_V]
MNHKVIRTVNVCSVRTYIGPEEVIVESAEFDLKLNSKVMRIWVLIDGHRTINDIIIDSGVDFKEVFAIINHLRKIELVEFIC